MYTKHTQTMWRQKATFIKMHPSQTDTQIFICGLLYHEWLRLSLQSLQSTANVPLGKILNPRLLQMHTSVCVS